MADNNKIDKNAVFGIWNEIKMNALGISDKTQAYDGFYVSFLSSGQPINKEDYQHPWKLGGDNTATSKASLKAVCDLADSRLQFKGDNLCESISSHLSTAYRLIIDSATPKPLNIPISAELKKQLDDANKVLETPFEDDPTIMDKSAKRKQYTKYYGLYQAAVTNYSMLYNAAQKDPIARASWDATGLIYYQQVTNALDDWEQYGYRKQVEDALDLKAAQGKDAAIEFLANAKRVLDPVSGMYNVQIGAAGLSALYTEISPSNWCDPEADGWTEYHFNSSESNYDYSEDSTSYGGGAGINLGFWSAGANVSHSEATQHKEFSSDKLKISFEYAIATINRPWMDTLFFRLNNWYLPGQKANAVSDSSEKQLEKIINQVDNAMFLPTVTSKIILVRNLYIENEHIREIFNASQSSTTAGASFGWGPFRINGNYSKNSSKVHIEDEGQGSGLRVKGVQLIGFISEIIPSSPKIDSPTE